MGFWRGQLFTFCSIKPNFLYTGWIPGSTCHLSSPDTLLAVKNMHFKWDFVERVRMIFRRHYEIQHHMPCLGGLQMLPLGTLNGHCTEIFGILSQRVQSHLKAGSSLSCCSHCCWAAVLFLSLLFFAGCCFPKQLTSQPMW